MLPQRFLSSSSSFVSSLASLGSASAGACAGGVCTVAAQAGTALAASTSGAAGLLGTTQAVLPFWQQHPIHQAIQTTTPLPWWMRLLILALLVSTGFTVVQLHDHPRHAVFAGAAGLLASCAELRWLPGGLWALYPVLAFAIPALVLAPWLPRIRLSQRSFRLLGSALLGSGIGALLVVVGLQIINHWQPCVLCWAQRAALVAGLWFLWRFLLGRGVVTHLLSSTAFLTGGALAIAQSLEMHQVHFMAYAAAACVRLGEVSCATAGARIWMGWPIANWSILAFAGFWTVSLILQPKMVRAR